MKKRALIVVAFIAILFTGCCKDTQETTPQDFFTLWNSCESLTALIDFVEDATNPSSSNYIKPEDRIATFDMDGTAPSSVNFIPLTLNTTCLNTALWMTRHIKTRLLPA